MLQDLIRTHGSAVASIFMRGISVVLSFAITFWIGRTMGPAANGQYALVTQTAILLSAVAIGGIDLAVVKEYARSRVAGSAIALGSYARLMLYSAGVAGILIIAIAVTGDRFFALLSDGSMASNSVAVLSVLLISRSLIRVTGAVLRSQGEYVFGQIVDAVLLPLLTIAFLFLITAGTVEDLLWCAAAAGIIAAATGLISSARFASPTAAATRIPFSAVFRSSMPFWGVVMLASLTDWYSLAIVAATQGIADAGVYRVAIQIGTALQIVSAGVFAVFSVKISEAFERKSLAEVGQASRAATILTAVIIVPVAIVLFAISAPLLNFVSPEFGSGLTVLRVIIVGQVIFSITGPSGLTLGISGHGRVNLYTALVSTLVLLASVPIASNLAGISGVAIAVSATIIGINLAYLVAVRRLVGINVMTGRVLSPED